LRHSPGSKKIYVKGERAPGEYWAASITMATPLHHNLKLYEDTPRIGRALFWATTLIRHTVLPYVSEAGVVGGGWNSGLISSQLMSQLLVYLTSHSARTSILRMLSPWAATSITGSAGHQNLLIIVFNKIKVSRHAIIHIQE
jgi:hypothetical protein